MTETIDGDFTAKHKRLTNISKVASFVAWLALAGFTLQALWNIFRAINSTGPLTILEVFDNDLSFLLSYFLSVLNQLLRGAIYWLVLKGISLGLKMIIETDLNYRQQSEGGSDE